MRFSARNSASKSTSPWPGETNVQPRSASPKSMCEPRIERAAVEHDLRVLDVHVVDAVGELAGERRRIEELRDEVARVEVDAEALAAVDRGQRLARGHEVVGDLRRVDLQREAHALGVEDVDDRPPALGEVLVAALHLRPVVGRERVQLVPDRRAGEAGDDRHAERRRGARGVLHALGGARAHALGIAVAPHLGRQDALVARVDRVAHRLADEVVADRPAPQAVALQQLAPAGRVLAARPAPRSTSKWSPQHASSRPSKPHDAARAARSSSVRSAHWPVKSVIGLAIIPPAFGGSRRAL